jgi:hypothetical protein
LVLAVREELPQALNQHQVAILFFPQIPQRAVDAAAVGLVDRPTHQTPEDRAAAVAGRVALAVQQVIPQALRHRKATQAVMVMDQHFGKARVAAVRVRLASMLRLRLQATVDRVLPTQSAVRP